MPRPRKLLTISHSYVVSLNRRLAHELSRSSKNRWEVTVVGPTYFHGSHDLRPVSLKLALQERTAFIGAEAYLTGWVHGFFYGRPVNEILRRGQWSLVHCWEEPYVLAGAQIAAMTPANIPFVFWTAQNQNKRYPPPFAAFEQYCLRRCAGWLACGTTTAQVMNARGYSRKPNRVLPLGVDLEHFQPHLNGSDVRHAEGWRSGDPRPVIGFLGRFTPEKGLPMLMRVLDQLQTPWRALLVGAGMMEGELRAWASRHGDRVRLCTGVQHDDVPRYLAAMDCLCAPSQTTPRWREQFGRMLIEAFACGIPVLGSDSGEIPFVIGDAGEIVPEADEAQWIERLDSLLQSPQRRAALCERGLDRVRREFAWPIVARRHIEFFDELIDGQSTARRFIPALLSPPVASRNAKPAPRRLLSIAHSYAVSMNRRLVKEMARIGGGLWDVTAVAPSHFHGSNDLRPVTFELTAEERRDAEYGIEVVEAKLTRHVHFFYYDRHLRELMHDRRRWDFVHAWEEPYIHVGNQIARWMPADVPLVYRTAQSLEKFYPPPFNWMEQYDMRRATGWICSGQLVAETLSRKPMYAQRPMRLIPLGVDLDVFRPNPAARRATRRALGWTEDGPPVIGYLGRFVRGKGLAVMMEALDRLRSPWRALFVGAGPMEGDLLSFAAKHQFADRVRVCTDVRHDQVPAYLNAMDVMAAPSQTTRHWREQFGRMLIEAFAAGTAVVGSSSGEIPFVIADAGIVCPESDIDAWATAFGDLIDNPSHRQELARRGRIRAQERYGWSIVGGSHIEFFNEMIDSRAARGEA